MVEELHGSFKAFSSPFDEVFFYYLMGICLSITITIVLCVLEMVGKRFPLMVQAFSSMLKVERRRLSCFGVDITITAEQYVINRCCKWAFRVVVVSVLCYLWQSLVLFQNTFTVSTREQFERAAYVHCRVGLACSFYDSHWRATFRWIFPIKKSLKICNFSDTDSIASKHPEIPGFLLCVGIPQSSPLQITNYAAIAYALYQLLIGSFQLGTWTVSRSSGRCAEIVFTVLAVFSGCLFFCALIFPQLYFMDTWFASISYLSIPVILILSREAGLALKGLVRERLKVDEIVVNFPRKITQQMDKNIEKLISPIASDHFKTQRYNRETRRSFTAPPTRPQFEDDWPNS